MRVVAQRIKEAAVTVNGVVTRPGGSILFADREVEELVMYSGWHDLGRQVDIRSRAI